MPRRVRNAAAAGDEERGRTATMGLMAHLAELKKRLATSFVALILAAIAAFALTDPIIEFLSSPIREIAAERDDLTALSFTTVTAAFDLRIRIAIAVGFIIAGPIWLMQLWLFLVPGLTRREVRWTLGFALSAIPLFAIGCITGMMISPHAIALMASFAPDGSAQLYQSSGYYDFILKLVLAVGIAFVTPVFLVLLHVAGLFNSHQLLRGWRVAVIVATAFAALATPAADVISMLLLATAMIGLYLGAWAVTLIFERIRRRRFQSADPRIAVDSVI
ncbi:twin-arginine translocase subunit TatC [Microbacterium sp. R86528]|uniref:twin-arginine translocase subunit TatC n=1 Tax=Microbacterium sp. R86528 TaxID=3093864 RepID=UPI0037C9AADC